MADGVNLKVGLDLQTVQGIKDFNKWANTVQAKADKNPIKIDFELDGQKYEKTVKTYIGKNGDLVESTKYVNKATKEAYEKITKMESAFDRAERATSKQAKSNNTLASSQEKVNKKVQKGVSVFDDFTTTFLKMAKFNTINLIYDAFTNQIGEAIETVEDFNKAMTEFKKVTDTSNLDLSEYTKTLGELGEATARTTKLVWSNVQ